MRRKSVHQRYGDLIAAMYEGAREVEAAITFRYEDGSQQVLKVPVTISDARGA